MKLNEKFRTEKIPMPESIFYRNHSNTLAKLLEYPDVEITLPSDMILPMKWNVGFHDKDVDLLTFQLISSEGFPILFTLPEIKAIIPIKEKDDCRIFFQNGSFCDLKKNIASLLQVLGRIYQKGSRILHVPGYKEDLEKQLSDRQVDESTIKQLLALDKEKQAIVDGRQFEKMGELREREKHLMQQIEPIVQEIEKDLDKKYDLKQS